MLTARRPVASSQVKAVAGASASLRCLLRVLGSDARAKLNPGIVTKTGGYFNPLNNGM